MTLAGYETNDFCFFDFEIAHDKVIKPFKPRGKKNLTLLYVFLVRKEFKEIL